MDSSIRSLHQMDLPARFGKIMNASATLVNLLSNDRITKLIVSAFPPDYWTSPWFAALCFTLGLIAILYLGFAKIRLDQAKVHRHMLEASRERERRAYETSDRLVQGLQAIAWSIENATGCAEGIEPLRGILTYSLKQSDTLIEEGRLNMKNLGSPRLGGNLPNEIAVAGSALQNDLQPKYRVIVHGEMRDLRPMVRDDVYRITREALSNAFRHAGANEIETEFCYKRTEIRIYVRDDGCGVSSITLSSRKHGLRNGILGMHREARRVGGILEIRSRPGAGTEIELRIPSALAYDVDESRTKREEPARFARGED